MGCSGSKAVDIAVPMPAKVKGNLDKKDKLADEKADSLRGSQASLGSCSDGTRSDRETSAKSTRTEDSGLGELEDENIISENSDPKQIEQSKASERPATPELTLEGTKVPRRKSPKERRVSFAQQQEDVRNRINSLSPLGGIIERPQSRGGLAFEIVCVETGNVKKRPPHLKKLDRRGKRSKRRTKEEIEIKFQKAEERRKEQVQELIGKAVSSRKEKQLKEAKALDDFAQRQIEDEEASS